MPVASKTHQLIESCQGLVRSLALKIHRGLPAQVELDDLIAYGQVGLSEAARDFDADRGQFSTFAYYRIRGAIYDGLSSMSWIKRSQIRRLKYEQMADEVLRLESEGGTGESAGNSGDDLEWLKTVTSSLAMVYLATQAAGDDDESAELMVADDSTPEPEERAMTQEAHQKLNELIDRLPPDAAVLIRAAYFEGLTLTAAAQRLGIGKAWASRLHAKALQQLGKLLRNAGIFE